MPEEQLEIIDENENVIGIAPRSHFHDPNVKPKLLHRDVHIYIIDFKSNNFWIHKRPMTKDLYPGFYDLCAAGHVDPGETPDKAALRELFEEYGISANKVFPLGKYVFESKWQKQMSCLYWLKTTETPKKSSEMDELKLVSFEELKALVKTGKTPENYSLDLELLEKSGLFK